MEEMIPESERDAWVSWHFCCSRKSCLRFSVTIWSVLVSSASLFWRSVALSPLAVSNALRRFLLVQGEIDVRVVDCAESREDGNQRHAKDAYPAQGLDEQPVHCAC